MHQAFATKPTLDRGKRGLSTMFYLVGVPAVWCICDILIPAKRMEKIAVAILLLFTDSRRVVVSYKQKDVHKVLVNRIVKLAQEIIVVR